MTALEHRPEPTFFSIIEYDVDGADTQQDLADSFADIQEQWVNSYPGYHSARIVASTDGQRLYNIVAWSSEASCREFEENSDGAGRAAAIQTALDALPGKTEFRMSGLPRYRLLRTVGPGHES